MIHHQEHFDDQVVRFAKRRAGAYSEEKNYFFLEFIKAERLTDDEEAEALWFLELIQEGVLGYWSHNRGTLTDEQIERRRSLLTLWGYGDKKSAVNPVPFWSSHRGVLSQRENVFISLHQGKAEGILFDIEPLYVACTFGLLAIDVFTTSGARMNELLQLSNTRECIQVKKVNEKLHYSFRAIPKGRDESEEFYISKQTMEYIQIVARMLKDHYHGDKIPSVKYQQRRSHLFPEPKPYYFQYIGQAMKDVAVSACMRFLLHGLRFQTQEGDPVTVKSHLLRHAFATEAVQRQRMPIDIVAKILHQRDVNVTGYYAAPTPTQVAQAMDELHDVISSYIDVDEALIRSPVELQREFDEYRVSVK